MNGRRFFINNKVYHLYIALICVNFFFFTVKIFFLLIYCLVIDKFIDISYNIHSSTKYITLVALWKSRWKEEYAVRI